MDNSIIPGKACRTCGEMKPLTAYRRRGDGWGDGYRVDCRKCMSKAKPKLPEGMKRCHQCREVKPKTGEYFRSNGSTPGLFKPVCKACTNLPPKPLAPAGKKFCAKCGAAKPATSVYFHTHKRSEALRSSCKACAHRETYTRFRDLPAEEKAAVWRRYGPTKAARRRARKLASGGKFGVADVRQQFAAQRGKCYWCGKKLGSVEQRNFHIDHIFALAKGGSNGPENICCACQPCNQSKGDKSPYEWAGRLF